MIIYYRLCEKEGRTLSGVPHWKNIDKATILKKCWLSLQQSVDSNDNIVLIQDSVSDETLNWMKSTAHTQNIFIEDGSFIESDTPEYIKLAQIIKNNTLKYQQEIHFLTADDYLCLPNMLNICKEIFKEGWLGYVVPQDYPDRYTLDLSRQCQVFINKDRHWRTVPSSTLTHMALGSVWQKTIDDFMRDALVNSDVHSYKAYTQSLAICPMPGLSTHLTENCMTPLVNWQKIWDDIKID